jgi:hypothetical protein
VYHSFRRNGKLLHKKQDVPFFTFLDAGKAFDCVHYCKVFRLLVERGLLDGIIRILINFYTVYEAHVLWSGYASDYFTVCNGVKQGRS